MSDKDEQLIKATDPSRDFTVAGVQDFTTLEEGDTLDGKTLSSIIFKSESSIVFLDPRGDYSWRMGSQYGEDPEDFGAVMSRADLLNSTPRDLLTEVQYEAFQRLLGGAVARVLDDRESSNAIPILDKAEDYLKTRAAERARQWYLASSFVVWGFASLLAVLLFVLRSRVEQKVGATGFELALATLMGSLGALLSIVRRITTIDIDPMAGKAIHYFEGSVRTIAGMFGAFLIALSVKAGILLGVINSTDQRLPFLLLIGVIAGASERLVPNMIRKVEGTLIVDSTEKQ